MTNSDFLVSVVLQLSLARDLESIVAIVRRAARQLTGADGATFILREGDFCHYVDEDSISPLWKGRHFPMESCISGWCMLHRTAAVIEDIYADSRIPADAYRPTFVKSLAIVPIRTADPIGAIGNYWATPHIATSEELRLLQALADSTSIAIENVQLYQSLEDRVRQRTAELEAVNQELEAFTGAVAHDLRSAIRNIKLLGSILKDPESSPEETAECFKHFEGTSAKMAEMLEGLLELSRAGHQPLRRERVNLSALATEIIDEFRRTAPERQVEVIIEPNLYVEADPILIRLALYNLIANAWKFTSKTKEARIEIGQHSRAIPQVLFIRDNGVGFDSQSAARIFVPFARLHSEQEFPGTGIGLMTVKRILKRHEGSVWAESSPGHGATFYFTVEPRSNNMNEQLATAMKGSALSSGVWA